MKDSQTGRRLYLAYGSNLNQADMQFRAPNAKVVGSVMVQHYELQFRGFPNQAYATIEPKQDSVVPALVWEITPQCEKALDRYEGYPRLYRKEMLTVELDGNSVETMVYRMNGHAPALPSNTYLSAMLSGYDMAMFDRSVLHYYLDETRSIYSLIRTIRDNQERSVYMPCPRCGQWWMDTESPFKNAHSRVTDLQVCDRCGNVEALEDHDNRLKPFTEWYAVQNPERFQYGEGTR